MWWWVACAEPEGEVLREAALLAVADRWVTGDVALDPLTDRPDDGLCPESGVYVEGGTIEVNTEKCTYAWLQQPTLVDLAPDDVVEIVFWHSALLADAPAYGHLAITLGEQLVHERWVDIPADAMAYTDRIVTPPAAPAGTMIGLHLHNHGANTWNVLRVERAARALD